MDDTLRLTDIFVGLMIATIPFGGYGISTGVVTLSVSNFFVLASTLVVFLCILREGEIQLNSIGTTVFFCYLIVLSIAALSTIINQGDPRRIVTKFGYLLVFSTIVFYATEEHRIKRLLKIWFFTAVLISVLTFISSVGGVEIGRRFFPSRTIFGFQIPFARTLGVQLSMGEYGMYTLAVTPLFIVLGIYEQNSRYLIGSVIIVSSIVMIAQSRSSWLAILSLSLVFFAFLPPITGSNVLDKIYRVLIIPIIISIGVFGFIIARLLISIHPGTVSLRIQQYSIAIQNIIANPLLGLGFGNHTHFFPKNNNLHNAFLRTGMESGILPLVLIVSIFVLVSRKLLVTSIYATTGYDTAKIVSLLAGLTAIVVETQFLVGYGKSTWAFLGILVSIFWNIDRSIDRET